jgi:uncharacterized membrane protein YagU involved in acid resistance
MSRSAFGEPHDGPAGRRSAPAASNGAGQPQVGAPGRRVPAGRGSAARAVAAGAPAGVAGGLLFGAAMAHTGTLPTVATLVGSGSSRAGFAVHMLISAVVGAGFGLLIRGQRCGPAETMFLGVGYGALWWCIGPLTLLPLALDQPPAWQLQAAQQQFPSLVGHLLYGVGTALAFLVLHGPEDDPAGRPAGGPAVGALLRGALAGALAALALRWVLEARSPALALGPALGVAVAALAPRVSQGAGAALVRGQAYGFVAWVAGELTIVPLLGDAGLRWSLEEARASFVMLPGYLLLGAVAALVREGLDGLAPLLSSEHLRSYRGATAGSGVLAAGLRGAVAGLLGGAVISQLMLQGAVPAVAERLTGSGGLLVGFAVNLAIAVAIGVSYGLLFRRLGQDVTCALGWGLSYGFLWWVLGPLTLLPALLGSEPQWTAAAAGGALSALAGHLVYGACLGVAFHLLEAPFGVPWLARSRSEALRAQRRRDQLLAATPALSALLVTMLLTTLVVVVGA